MLASFQVSGTCEELSERKLVASRWTASDSRAGFSPTVATDTPALTHTCPPPQTVGPSRSLRAPPPPSGRELALTASFPSRQSVGTCEQPTLA